MGLRVLAIAMAAGLMAGTGAMAAPPRPDHVVIVIEENHAFQQVLGYSGAAYFNQLAAQGAVLTSMYGITHPSQPNYLEFFSGTNQGFTDNTEPTNIPWATPNLGAALISAGATFTGFAEDLPGVGSLVWESGKYARRHVPWTNWQSATPGANQLPPTVNQPVSAFPTDFATLPAVSIVIPNNDHNMHDGTIEQANAWLQGFIAPYVQWAATHNSLLIVTWDEDESASRNHIPTILVGPMVRQGAFDSVWTLHDLQRTVADMYGATPSGAGASVQGFAGVWTTDPTMRSVKFQQGAGGYAGTLDTFVEYDNPIGAHGGDDILVSDGSPLRQVLIRFDDVFGTTAGKVPAGATIAAAHLMILTGTTTSDNSATASGTYRMLSPWTDGSTWNSLAGGISANGVECAAVMDSSRTPSTLDVWTVLDVTASVRAWAGAMDPNGANRGWAILPAGTDGWRFHSSEAASVAERPLLEITYVLPPSPPCAADFNMVGGVTVADIFAFLSAWFAQGGLMGAGNTADFNGDLLVNVGDIFAFLAAWFAGC